MRLAWVLGLSALIAAPGAFADRLQVQAIRLADRDGATRIELRLSRPADFQLFTLSDPHRVVLDIHSAALGPSALPLPAGGGAVRQLRVAHRPGGHLRVVFDVAQPVMPSGAIGRDQAGALLSIRLEPAGLVAGTSARQGGTQSSAAVPSPVPEPRRPPSPTAASQAAASQAAAPQAAAPQAGAREIVIAVDAGHGGHDPGARGPTGLLEKEVTLAISRRLVALLDEEPGMRGVLTRSGDQFVVLRQRMERARTANADLFISIHADAAHNRQARGSTVYVLSEKGASDEAARRLAARENAALIGGVELGDKDPVLASVLMDLSQNASISSSIEVGNAVLRHMSRLGHLHRPTVQMAPFMVLKSPDVPSILVETAYISNPDEERQLRTAAFQDRLARAILAGVREYFRENPPRGTLLAATDGAPAPRRPVEHVIQRGDTLSGIASMYDVSIQRIRVENRLRNDRVMVGQRLRIPRDDT